MDHRHLENALNAMVYTLGKCYYFIHKADCRGLLQFGESHIRLVSYKDHMTDAKAIGGIFGGCLK